MTGRRSQAKPDPPIGPGARWTARQGTGRGTTGANASPYLRDRSGNAWTVVIGPPGRARPAGRGRRVGRVERGLSQASSAGAAAVSVASVAGHGPATRSTATGQTQLAVPCSDHRPRAARARVEAPAAGARRARPAVPADRRCHTTAGRAGRRRCGRCAAPGPLPRLSGSRAGHSAEGHHRRRAGGHRRVSGRTGRHEVSRLPKADQSDDFLTRAPDFSAVLVRRLQGATRTTSDRPRGRDTHGVLELNRWDAELVADLASDSAARYSSSAGASGPSALASAEMSSTAIVHTWSGSTRW
jgi:hypothetical protein